MAHSGLIKMTHLDIELGLESLPFLGSESWHIPEPFDTLRTSIVGRILRLLKHQTSGSGSRLTSSATKSDILVDPLKVSWSQLGKSIRVLRCPQNRWTVVPLVSQCRHRSTWRAANQTSQTSRCCNGQHIAEDRGIKQVGLGWSLKVKAKHLCFGFGKPLFPKPMIWTRKDVQDHMSSFGKALPFASVPGQNRPIILRFHQGQVRHDAAKNVHWQVRKKVLKLQGDGSFHIQRSDQEPGVVLQGFDHKHLLQLMDLQRFKLLDYFTTIFLRNHWTAISNFDIQITALWVPHMALTRCPFHNIAKFRQPTHRHNEGFVLLVVRVGEEHTSANLQPKLAGGSLS